MEFLHEPTLAVFLALVLSLIVAKIVSFAVSNSSADVDSVVSSVSEGAVAKEVTLGGGLMVRRGKGKGKGKGKGEKRVKFVDDVVIRRIDRYEGSGNLELVDDVEEVGKMIVEEKRVDQFEGSGLGGYSGVRKSNEEYSDLRDMDDAVADGVASENVDALVTSGVKSEVELEGDDCVIDDREGNGEIGCGEGKEDVREEGMLRGESVTDEDDDWEGIERSELEKVFAEAVNYVEYGGKDKEDDRFGILGSEVQMQLYGLHKVAVEGPCCEPQPMALMVSARAKWNSWQRLGSMNQEEAMEQYIEVLSKNLPERMHKLSDDYDIERKMEAKDEIYVAEHQWISEQSNTPDFDASAGRSSVDKVDAV